MPDDEDPSTAKPEARESEPSKSELSGEPSSPATPRDTTELTRVPKPADSSRSTVGKPDYETLFRSISQITELNGEATRRALQGIVLPDTSALISRMALPSDALLRLTAQINAAISPAALSAMRASLENVSKALANWPTLSRAADFAKPDPPKSAYSEQMESPASYFAPAEVEINSFNDLHGEITKLIGKTPDLPLVWRGARRATWGLHSHLYRHLMDVNGVRPPAKKPKREQPYPDENQMVAAEREILRLARDSWRFDNMSALETFARIQHAGGPTRLIDVTMNPYVAAWFAVESNPDDDGEDARLFAIATRPVEKEGKPPAGDSTIRLDEIGSRRDPFWHVLETPAERQKLDWGTGSRRRLWVPPAYDPRISAQNAAFILDGVPITSQKTAPYFTIEHNVYWRRADLLASSSIYLKMLKPSQRPRYNAPNFAPTFSFRIAAAKKAEIREYLESRFGYGRAYIYPDMAGLADQLKDLPLAEQ